MAKAKAPKSTDVLDSDSVPVKGKADKYGDVLQDFGYLKLAEARKDSGNSLFKANKYEEALAIYDGALNLLKIVSEDTSMTIGEKQWADIVNLRSTVQLNKSSCYYKMKNWSAAIEGASACLVGNVLEDLKFSAPHVQKRWEELCEKTPWLGVPEVDKRLTRATCAKAWFRLTKCYAHLGYPDRAKFLAVKALKSCDDKQMRSTILQFCKPFDAMAKKQTTKEKKHYEGFFTKLQEEGGGYMQQKFNRKSRTSANFSKLSRDQKMVYLEELDGSVGDSDSDNDKIEGLGDGTEALGDQFALEDTPSAEEEKAKAAKAAPPTTIYAFNEVWSSRRREEEVRMQAWMAKNCKAPSKAEVAEDEEEGEE